MLVLGGFLFPRRSPRCFRLSRSLGYACSPSGHLKTPSIEVSAGGSLPILPYPPAGICQERMRVVLELHGVGQGFRTDLLEKSYKRAREERDLSVLDDLSGVRVANPYVAVALRDIIERDYVKAKVRSVRERDHKDLYQIEELMRLYDWVRICVGNLKDLDEVDDLIEKGLIEGEGDVRYIPELLEEASELTGEDLEEYWLWIDRER